MYECSLVTSTQNINEILLYLKKEGWNKTELNHTERIFIGNNFKIILIPEQNKLIYKSIYDYNKNRTSICCAYNSYTIIKSLKTEEELVNLDLKFKKEIKILGFLFVKNEIKIEILKINNKFLIKLFVSCELPFEGEKRLEEEKENLKDFFNFIKPPVDWFNLDYKKEIN
ncbi:hypothetical protein TUBRATIS_007840 [Tubulinosema ratisbonensis]|uniref:Uncharacterized protein n=1 Tax=Tubulinosema ratisbonensis TaxID=291195 RepID=A0A437ANG5_9MICR|nr:hypothetical protein TUBRATIS_007840 [Tubulinosema ratisbonensis]